MPDLQQPRIVDENHVLQQYESKIKYYWDSSRNNKKLYKRYRTWSVILGAFVTLISSISAAESFNLWMYCASRSQLPRP